MNAMESQTHINHRWAFGIAAALLAVAVFARPGSRVSADQTCTLQVSDDVPAPSLQSHRETVLVTLYFKGEPVRSTELPGPGSSYAIWHDLNAGAYELHFEAKGHGKVIKRLVLNPDAASSVSLQSLGDKDEMWGAGPTLYDLEKRITALEKAKG